MKDNIKYFTLYWLNGSRNVIKGASIEDAFAKAGYGRGAIKAVDWYDYGITNTHRFVKGKGWERYEPLNIHVDDFKKSLEENREAFIEQLMKYYEGHHGIWVTFSEGRDKWVLGYGSGVYAEIGAVEYITTYYASDAGEEDSFYVTASMYYPVTEVRKAVEEFILRVTTDVPINTGDRSLYTVTPL